MLEVNGFDLNQRKVTFSILGRPHLAGDSVPGAQVELADLRWGNVNIIRTRQIVVVGGTKKAETVRQRFQDAFTEDEAALFGLRLQDLEDQLLLPHSGSSLDVKVFGNLRQRGDVHLLQLRDVHGGCALWAI